MGLAPRGIGSAKCKVLIQPKPIAYPLPKTEARDVAIVGKRYRLWFKSKHFCQRETTRKYKTRAGKLNVRTKTVNFLLTSGGSRNRGGDGPIGDAVPGMLGGKYGSLWLGDLI